MGYSISIVYYGSIVYNTYAISNLFIIIIIIIIISCYIYTDIYIPKHFLSYLMFECHLFGNIFSLIFFDWTIWLLLILFVWVDVFFKFISMYFLLVCFRDACLLFTLPLSDQKYKNDLIDKVITLIKQRF